MAKKAVLGKGLGALIDNSSIMDDAPRKGQSVSAITAGAEIEIAKIYVNPNQPRKSFDDSALDELAASIKVHGIIQPLTLRRTDEDKYQIISGERRFRAAQRAGLETVPAYLRTADDGEMLEMALIENIQREDLDAMEIAFTYRRLMDECNFTQEELSERIGKKRATVANYLRLLSLEYEVQQAVRQEKLSMGHARALAGVENPHEQSRLANKIIKDELSVRQAEELIKLANEDKKIKQKKTQDDLPERFCNLLELLEPYFNNRIQIRRNDKGEGSIVINFASDDDIERFIQNLSK
ncbi:MAG: ParB/RepB/Spo0J family partition protein [Prevotellaceae bacterium]|jgi:ParB family chromosome partitioning protein|nr:ParB/RepB/Spo0J family partition protein [Prevotellaceae bacterium]